MVEAADALEEALRLLEWDPVSPPGRGTSRARLIARVLTTRALGLTYAGDAPLGLELLDRAAHFVHESDRGILLLQRGLILKENGRLVDALRWFQEAEPLLERYGPDWLYAGLFHNLALLHRDLGELEHGLRCAQRALELFSEQGNNLLRAKARHVEALLWLDLGDIVRAIPVFEEVREEYRSTAPDLEAFVNDGFAEALRRVGLYRQASVRWAEAIETWRLNGNLRDSAVAEYRRALVAYEDGDGQAAIELAKKAMDSLYGQRNEPVAFLARILVLQAQFDHGADDADFPTKVSLMCEALENRGWTRRIGQVKALEARAHIRAGDLSRAESLLRQPLEENDSEMLAAILGRQLALAELARARGADPSPEVNRGLNALDAYRAALGSIEFQAGVSALGRQLASIGLGAACETGNPSLMMAWAERSRAQAFRIAPVKITGAPEVREALGRLRQARQRLWDAQLKNSNEVGGLLLRVRELEDDIRVNGWATPGPGQQTDPLLPEEMGAVAAECATVLVSQFACKGALQAVLAIDGELLYVKLGDLEAAAEIGSRLGADLDALGAPYPLPPRLQKSVESSLRRNGEALAREVWDPIADLVGDRSIVMIPHSRLRWVPWPLLPPLRGRPMTVAPSAEAWYRAVNRPAATGPALIAAGPALHRANNEIDEVSKLYPGAKVINDGDSDPVAVLEALDGASVAHLAAHGHHETDNVLFSRLNFARGPLNAYELLSLDQAPAHVVLSSCELGRSNVAVGDESLGFTAALLHAGTATVVSSLGRVPDELAADMMIDYHRRCAAGATPAEALAAAGEQRPWHPFVCFGA